jgi:hypothetical protein
MRKPQSFQSNDRAASVITGQVLLFTLVITGVLSVTAVGIPVLEEQQAEIQVDQAEDALIEVNDAFANAAETGQNTTETVEVPASTVQIGGNETTVNISDGTRTHRFTTAPIRVATAGRTLAYEAGVMGTIPDTPGESSLIYRSPAESRLGTTSPTHQIQFLAINHTAQARTITNPRAGEIELQIQPQAQTTVSEFDGADGAHITVETKNPRIWVRYLDNHAAFGSVSQSGDTVTATLDSNATLRVRASTTIVKLI